MWMKKTSLGLLVAAAIVAWQLPSQAQVVPGSGQQILELGDDFEDANWSYTLNLPKASSNIDKVGRPPTGFSSNGMWFESAYRGTPDFVKRLETPPGGIPGSTGALGLQTLYSGIPGQLSNKFQQDDLIANVQQKLGYMLPASWTPSYVVRVYVPPFEQWEQRIGSSFGFRADCQTIINKPTKVGKLFRTGGTSREIEQYWPGFFLQFNGKGHPQHTDKNTATILIRSGERGQDIPGPVILHEGWLTLGMTITPDGQVHYYGHEGVANLTAKDHLYSNYPYGYKCLQTSTYFFNVVNQDDGRTWSTRWIVDDPKVYVASGSYTPRQQPQTAQAPVQAQPVSQTKPAQPATTPAAPAVQTTPALTPPASTTPATQTAPITKPVTPLTTPAAAPAPATSPAVPTSPATPQAVQPMPTQAPALQTTPAAPTTTTSKATIDALAPLLSPPSAAKPAGPSTSSLPPLATKPSPITPAKAAKIESPAPAPALLPEPSPTAAPVISIPTPAPAASPVESPALASPAAPTAPPAPAKPE